jgi:hypothetical protein
MAHDFEAVFSPGLEAPAVVLDGLESLLREYGMQFTGAVFELEAERDGSFQVAEFEPTEAESIQAVRELLKRWRGVSVGLTSNELLLACGRGAAVEVDVRICKHGRNGNALSYRENGGAWLARRRSRAMLLSLGEFLLRLALLGKASSAIYDEETAGLTAQSLNESLAELAQLGSFPAGGRQGLVVLPTSDVAVVLTSVKGTRDDVLYSERGLTVIGFGAI